jgi:hypothetical protein
MIRERAAGNDIRKMVSTGTRKLSPATVKTWENKKNNLMYF